MSDKSTHIFRISETTESGISYHVEFSLLKELELAAKEFFAIERIVEVLSIVRQLREKCRRSGLELYIPIDEKIRQDLRLCLSAAASYPNELPKDFIESVLGMPYNSYKVYAYAKDYESRHYLSVTASKGIQISMNGIAWIEKVLRTQD
jgi:hypothetical protein